ncbi:MAG: hypothetical protein HZA90_21325 [Verrucomicrobia bacterium]|nr:hypothetical protein [Verrucomicrobiota bacterium]
MKANQFLGWSSALCLSAALALPAQETISTNQLQQLQQQLRQLQQAFEQMQSQYRQQIDGMQKQIDALQQAQSAAAEKKKLEDEIAAKLGTEAKPAASTPTTPVVEARKWSPSQPIPVMRTGSAYMNVSFDALLNFGGSTASDPSKELQLGDHDPIQRGFSLRNAELVFDGAVDPYFKGAANLALKLDQNNETELELEEAFLQTTALPANLQLKAGQFFANFGRQNPQHPHQWALVDQPLVLNRAFGPDGLRNVGAQLSWLAPLPFFTEASLGFLNSGGGTAWSFRHRGEDDGTGVERFVGRATLARGLRGPGDFLYVPRLASSFDLTEQQTLVVGLSGAFGPNDTGPRARTEIYGADVYWKWKPANAQQGFPFVSWQTEALWRRLDAGADPTAVPALPAERIVDYGFYSQVLWGFKPRWVAGLRGEWATGNEAAYDASDVFRGERTRVSPVLTWYPSEFSKIRLQYNYDHGRRFGDEHSVWLQVEFLLGAHGAHKF